MPKPMRPTLSAAKNGRARTGELIEHHVATRRAVEQRIGDERDRLYRRVRGERLHAVAAERVDARIGPDIGAIATETTQFDIVSVSDGRQLGTRRSVHAANGRTTLGRHSTCSRPRDSTFRRKARVRRRSDRRCGANPCRQNGPRLPPKRRTPLPSVSMRNFRNCCWDISPEAKANSGCRTRPRPPIELTRRL